MPLCVNGLRGSGLARCRRSAPFGVPFALVPSCLAAPPSRSGWTSSARYERTRTTHPRAPRVEATEWRPFLERSSARGSELLQDGSGNVRSSLVGSEPECTLPPRAPLSAVGVVPGVLRTQRAKVRDGARARPRISWLALTASGSGRRGPRDQEPHRGPGRRPRLAGCRPGRPLSRPRFPPPTRRRRPGGSALRESRRGSRRRCGSRRRRGAWGRRPLRPCARGDSRAAERWRTSRVLMEDRRAGPGSFRG